jgi:exopolysaccharide production protein ExoY
LIFYHRFHVPSHNSHQKLSDRRAGKPHPLFAGSFDPAMRSRFRRLGPTRPREQRSQSDVRSNAGEACIGGRTKRAVDVVLAGAALVLAAPIMVLIALVIRVTMGAPVIYAHERVGLNGRRFTCFKFRTMVTNADDVLRQHLEDNPEAAREWQLTQKLIVDPRVPPIGRFLRKSSLDELPQIINILRGDMSCVGPRPVTAAELDKYGPRQKEYLSALPGLTGLWQCSGRSALDYAQRVELDTYYVRNWSLLLDIRIIFWTVPTLLRFHQTA